MKNVLTYKGYLGTVEYSEKDNTFFGRVLIKDEDIKYYGQCADEFIGNFHAAVDDYIERCIISHKDPEISYKGTFNIRVAPEIHRLAVICAMERGITLNKFVDTAIKDLIEKHFKEQELSTS